MARERAIENRGATIVETALLLIAVTLVTGVGVRMVGQAVRTNAAATADELGRASSVVVTTSAHLPGVVPSASAPKRKP